MSLAGTASEIAPGTPSFNRMIPETMLATSPRAKAEVQPASRHQPADCDAPDAFSASPAQVEVALRFAMTRAAKFVRRLPALQPVDEDAYSGEAARAVAEARATYDPSLGVRFQSYAYQRVGYALLEERRRQDWLTRSRRGKMRRGEATPLAHELPPVSLDVLAADFDERRVDWLVDPNPGPEEQVLTRAAAEAEAERIREAMSRLDPRERTALYLRFWLEQQQDVIGWLFGVSVTRVNQLHHRALAKLKWMLMEIGSQNGGPRRAGVGPLPQGF